MAPFNVQVPPGALAGTTIQVQSPNGVLIQVQVPPGVAPGQTFQVMEPEDGPGGAPTSIGQPGLVLQANATAVPRAMDDLDFDQFIPLPTKTYDVTNYGEMISQFLGAPCMGITTKKLILTDQEAILKVRNCCGGNTQKMPYSQLGSVDKAKNACMAGFSSDFVPPMQDGTPGGIFPGCGCDEAAVNEIITELQGRKEKRGSIAQMRKLEYMSSKVVNLARQSLAFVQGMGSTYEPTYKAEFDPPKIFGTREFDVSSTCEKLCCASKSLKLEQEEALLTSNACFGCQSVQQKREYAQLGEVATMKQCIICRAVSSNLGAFSPGLGCEKGKVLTITQEMRQRMGERGTIGQIRRQEKTFKMFTEIDKTSSEALSKMGVQYPPDQSTMDRVWKGQYPSVEMLQTQGVAGRADVTKQVSEKTYDVTNKIDACGTCFATCGAAGCTKTTINLTADMMIMTEKNNIDDESVHVPYAQIDSVDWEKNCCCCYQVNGISPGYGCCNKDQVETIAGELQRRKLARGNIAQLHQLEAMQSTAIELNARWDLALDKEGMAFPPAQVDIDKVYTKAGKPMPRALSVPKTTPHIGASEILPSKTYNITNIPSCICTFLWCRGVTSETLDLSAEELHITRKNWCDQQNVRMPYAEMSSVEVETACCCCSELPDIGVPGFGCSNALVAEIAEELQQRKVKRGEIAQFKMQENMINEVLKIGVKMDCLLDKKGFANPADQPPPEAQIPAATTVQAPTKME
eukprot:TRINITY_DN7664_c0_g1_i1.p1 TRINITY_DN7664_c0_g1~~TRINITY_DN7664_c0_g1_i1.p1  ORF type:complete len:745 (+),score=221.80 TRINITY_DN7664_c0_g1_i1:84-2318(+)